MGSGNGTRFARCALIKAKLVENASYQAAESVVTGRYSRWRWT